MTTAPTADEAILAVRDLKTELRGDGRWQEIVRSISFDLLPGKTVAIVGESGSGKSVTALSILGLTRVMNARTSGSVMFEGSNLLTMPDEPLRQIRGNRIAMVFQEPMTSLNPVLTIGDQIAESLVFHQGRSWDDARAETARLLDRVRIPSAASRLRDYPQQFSGGMRQRVMIAMALACNPKILIADEPTTALDVTIQAGILDLLKDLQREHGMAILFITHDMGVVAEMADETIVMLKGRIVEQGATEAIFRKPQATYTKALLSAVPRLGSMKDETLPRRFAIMDAESGVMVEPPTASDTVGQDAPIIQVEGLTTRFDVKGGLFGKVEGRVHAVENVSFDIRPGETLALVGESGCGKSTTGRSIVGITKATAGSIRVDGQEILGERSAFAETQRRRIQMIFQDPFASLNPRIRIGDAICEPMLVQGRASRAQAREEAVALVKAVGLDPSTLNRFPHEFSGGQRQRVCIARALSTKPSLIVADEAVSALDVSIKAQTINLMIELQERFKLAYLFISHDMAVVERISHRVAVMYLGEIVEIGPRAAIFGNPQHPYTIQLLSAVPVPDPEHKGKRRSIKAGELRTPVRAADYVPPARRYMEASPGHFVQAWEQ